MNLQLKKILLVDDPENPLTEGLELAISTNDHIHIEKGTTCTADETTLKFTNYKGVLAIPLGTSVYAYNFHRPISGTLATPGFINTDSEVNLAVNNSHGLSVSVYSQNGIRLNGEFIMENNGNRIEYYGVNFYDSITEYMEEMTRMMQPPTTFIQDSIIRSVFGKRDKVEMPNVIDICEYGNLLRIVCSDNYVNLYVNEDGFEKTIMNISLKQKRTFELQKLHGLLEDALQKQQYKRASKIHRNIMKLESLLTKK